MESPMDLIPTISKKDILEQKRKEKEKENADTPNLLDTVILDILLVLKNINIKLKLYAVILAGINKNNLKGLEN